MGQLEVPVVNGDKLEIQKEEQKYEEKKKPGNCLNIL